MEETASRDNLFKIIAATERWDKRLVLFCLTSFILSCTTETTTTTVSNREAEKIKQLEFASISAEFRLDTATLSSFYHDDFISVYPNKLQNKQQEIAGIYNGMVQRKQQGETMDSLYLDNFQVRFHDNTAIATFHTVTKGVKNNVPFENTRWRWYDVWVKQKGEWKLAASQGTPISN